MENFKRAAGAEYENAAVETCNQFWRGKVNGILSLRPLTFQGYSFWASRDLTFDVL